jgi:shikimate dehydrogenase
MRHFGLIGYPLSHSFSKGFFTGKFEREGITDCRYENYPLEDISALPGLIAGDTKLEGLNVTIPYKEKVLPLLDGMDSEAREVGAVNTIRIERKGGLRLTGFNTDVYGFRKSLEPLLEPGFKKALILGTGGASKAVAHVLRQLGMEVTWVSRSPGGSDRIAYADVSAALIAETPLIVNCSPLGMVPDTGTCPDLPYSALTPGHVLYDLIYNPEETRFLAHGRKQGAKTKNGLQMLHLQAEKSWEIWNGR